MPRRAFLRRVGYVASAVGVPALLPKQGLGASQVPAPSERITVALIGHGAMGSGHLRRLAGDPTFQVLGVCDVDQKRREAGQAVVDGMYSAERARGSYRGCVAENDYRVLLARPDLDAVVLATPDHWHALQSIHAARAGKDVYCEKPISMTIEEGRRVVEVVRRYGRVFQTGTQYRSIGTIRRVVEFVRGGGLGRVKSVFTLLNPVGLWTGSERFKAYADVVAPAQTGRSFPPLDFALAGETVPDGLDWDLWVGPAPWRPYHRLYHTNPSPGVVPWSFCDAFGVTSLTWHLAHSADVIQYALGVERSGPVEIIHPGTGEFPTMTCRYSQGTLLHFVEHWGQVKELYKAVPSEARLAGNFGGLFVGERGWITSMTTGGPVEAQPESLLKEVGLSTRDVQPGANDHHANWVAAMKARTAPSCDEELGHRTATLGHVVNVAWTVGHSLRWDPGRECFEGSDAADRLRARALRPPWHLGA